MKNEVAKSRSQAEFHAEVVRRTRAVLGLRGVKNAKEIPLNLTRLNRYSTLTHVVVNENELALLVKGVVSDTLSYL